MAVVTTTQTTVSFRDQGFLNAGISASATTITVAAIFKYPSGVKTQQGFSTTGGFAVLENGGRFERISFGTVAVDSTTKVTTLTDVRRGISQTATTPNFTAGTGIAWPKGTRIIVSNDPNFFQGSAYIDLSNTFTTHQLISSTNELRFADTATAIWDDGTNLSFKDSANATITLSTIAAAAGADQKVGVDVAATAGFLGAASNDGVLRTGTGLTYTDGGDYVTLAIVDPVVVATGGSGRQVATAYAVVCGGTTTTAAHQSIASVGTTGQALTSNGAAALPTFQNAKETVQLKAVSFANSTTLTNPTSATAFDSGQYTIPADDIVAGVVYEFEANGSVTYGESGVLRLQVILGATLVVTLSLPADTGTDLWYLRGFLIGTAAAGASVAVRSNSFGKNATAASEKIGNESTSVATNAEKVMSFGALFETTNGANTIILANSTIKKMSTTAF